MTEHIVTLPFGYPDKSDDTKVHNRVTFGRRPIAEDLLKISADPQSKWQTQFSLMLQKSAMTAFGDLKMPAPLSVFLSLNSTDRNIIREGYAEFLARTLGERSSESLSDTKVRLAIGFERNGELYDTVEFGRLLTGFDELEADRRGLEEWQRTFFLYGKEIVSLSQSGGALTIDGPLDVADFTSLDLFDCSVLREAEERWLNSFRKD